MVVAAAVAALAVVTPASAPAQGAADDDGLRYEARSVYRADPDAGVVHVSVDVTVTHQKAGGASSYYILQSMGVLTLDEAANHAVASADGRALPVTVEPVEDGAPVSIAVVDLQPNLSYGDTASFTLTYDLPNHPPRSEGTTRVNRASAVVLPVPVGDPGLSSVDVVVPERFEIEIVGDHLERAKRDGNLVYSASGIDPFDWYAVVLARDDDALDASKVRLRERTFDILAWPGDTEWAGFVGTHVEEGVPVLEKLVGQPWPSEGALTITETYSPYVYGYAGWYDNDDHAIEIGDELDAVVVLHELAHVWFDDDLFTDRWVGEAFAEEFATRALAEMGEPLKNPEPIDEADPGAQRLNDWSNPSLLDEISDDQERYGYNTSWSVLRQITGEIGVGRLADVIAAAADEHIAYRGDGSPEAYKGRASWRRLLDLLEEVGGSTIATDLFGRYVVAESQVPLLAERTAARAAVDQLEVDGGGWAAPLPLRKAMAGWQFGKVAAMVEDARAILAVRAEIESVLDPAGLAVPARLERVYEQHGAIDAAEAAGQYLDVARTVANAAEAADADRSLMARIGLLGSGADVDASLSAVAYADGSLVAAEDAGRAAIEAYDEAAEEGQRRLGAAVTVGLLVAWVVAARRSGILLRRT